MSSKLGLDCKLYYLSTGTRTTWGSPAAAPENLTEIDNVQDLTLNLEHGEADLSTRESSWRQTGLALKDGSVEFTMLWDTSDAAFTAIKDAWLNKTNIALAILDGSKATVGTQGLWADFVVTSFGREEPLEEGVTVPVTVKPARSTVAPEWVTVAT